MHPHQKACRNAKLLIAPAALIALVALILVPWMIETRHRLQNEHWEGQLSYAIAALGFAAIALPFLILRVCRRVPVLCICGWTITAVGHIALISYVLQSHLSPSMIAVFALLGFGCLVLSLQSLRLDCS